MAREAQARVLTGAAGRGHQLHQATQAARGCWIWMLHADSRIDASVLAEIVRRTATSRPGWGRFDVVFDDPHPLLRVVAFFMNVRSRITAIQTGDQGIFVHRALLDRVGGIPRQALMEDIELSRRLKRCGMPACCRAAIRSSARRWQQHGYLRTILLMWWLRWRYWRGADPERLARIYHV